MKTKSTNTHRKERRRSEYMIELGRKTSKAWTLFLSRLAEGLTPRDGEVFMLVKISGTKELWLAALWSAAAV